MDKGRNVIITEKPALRHPYMVCGISGWLDGGESGTGSVQYLLEKLRAKRFLFCHTIPYPIFGRGIQHTILVKLYIY